MTQKMKGRCMLLEITLLLAIPGLHAEAEHHSECVGDQQDCTSQISLLKLGLEQEILIESQTCTPQISLLQLGPEQKILIESQSSPREVQRELGRDDWVNQQLGSAHIISALAAGMKLDLFGKLSASPGGLTFADLAQQLNVSRKGLDALLVSLVTQGFVDQDAQSKKLLCKPNGGLSEATITNILMYDVAMQRQLYYVADSVKEGQAVGLREVLGDYPSLYVARDHIPEVAKYWDPWMKSQNRLHLDEKVDSLVNYSRSATPANMTMLDWCGNDGYNSFAAIRRHPGLRSTVLDLPLQCEKTAANALSEGLASKIDTCPCDLMDSSFSVAPRHFDVILMTHTIREWSSESVQRFFGLVHDALNPGGSVLVDMVLNRTLGEYPPLEFPGLLPSLLSDFGIQRTACAQPG
eukprot:TRINITY_DN19857_c0_g1_i2.p1 TRINITY_DN19857_c0_g1~~TRINITY_DN19857_c0_g1_i2.p1  ORF type:complete len:409 (+),score=63.29 TRINITY_DN19857_c0_g1_i2:77-1303(+)